MNRAVFLDRDGVITADPPHYAYEKSKLKFIPKADRAIRLLNKNGFMVVVVSNQSGIARGYYSEESAVLFNQVMKERLEEKGARIDAMYYCPHHPEAQVAKYRVNCECRKPKPGMLKKSESDWDIDLRNSFIIGDKETDLETGKAVGCKTILVKTGYGLEELRNKRIDCDYVADDLYEAARYIVSLTHQRLVRNVTGASDES